MVDKILYIGFRHEYGRAENGLAINYKGWFQGFESLGYELNGVFFDDFSGQELQGVILERARQWEPDMVFFILQRDQVSKSTLEELVRRNIFTVGFFGDDQWRFDGWTSQFAGYFSVCLTTDKFSLRKYYDAGQKNVIYTQWASLECDKPFLQPNYKFDVSFIGGLSRYRKWFVRYLEKQGINVVCFGDGWPNGRVSYQEMASIFRESKINLNISNSVSYDIRFIFSSLKSLLSYIRSLMRSSAKNSSQTKARNFEIPVSGGFQLTDYVPTLDEYLNIGREVVCYNTIDEVGKLVNYYLDHDCEREGIKKAGVEIARREHTFSARIVKFMCEIEKIIANKQ